MQAKQLLAGNAGLWFREDCLRPEINNLQCDVMDLEAYRAGGKRLRDGTKSILILGADALKALVDPALSLNQHRGTPLSLKEYPDIPAIASYLPVDAFDMQDWEKDKNPYLNPAEAIPDGELTPRYNEDGEEDADAEDESIKDHGKTRRSNYRFWLTTDTRRVKDILLNFNGKVPCHPTPQYVIYPTFEEAYETLITTKNKTLYLDIETDMEERPNLRCIGFSFGFPSVFVVPIFRYDGSLAYGERTILLVRALAAGMRDNEVVVHNSMFDLFILAHYYKIPFGRKIYDTMISHHKAFVGVEKSLGHAMSHLTWLPYHKDEGIFAPHNAGDERKLWEYNGKDIYGMMLVKEGLDGLASKDAGLKSSIECTNNALYAYLVNSLMGICFDEDKATAKIQENDRKMMQIMRMIKILAGFELLPSSNKQCIHYFHELMGYKVMARSEKTHRASLGKSQLYKMKLWLKSKEAFNPILDLTIEFRRIQKQTSGLQFIRWNCYE
jgi:hypothetical protein